MKAAQRHVGRVEDRGLILGRGFCGNVETADEECRHRAPGVGFSIYIYPPLVDGAGSCTPSGGGGGWGEARGGFKSVGCCFFTGLR